MSDPAVRLRDVFCLHRTGHGDAAALQGLSLELGRGERVCVIGPSGAGKTTLLRVIAGLQAPSAGSMLVFGEDPGRLSAPGRARLRQRWIGFMDQHAESTLSPDLTIAQSIALPLALRGTPRKRSRARVAELLDATGLSERAGARAAELSGGERQRVALCAAVAHRPGLLLADEPTAELDTQTAAATAGAIATLSEAEGTTVLVVSHDPALAASAQRTLRIRDGRIVEERADGEPALVVGDGGWVRLPEALREAANINGTVRARSEPGAIVLSSTPDTVGRSSPATTVLAVPPASESPVVVTVAGVVRARGRGGARRLILDQFTARFAAGRLTVLTGPSGSGKTTLLELVAGLDRADAGEVRLDGVDLGRLAPEPLAALRRERMGYLTQEPAPVGFLSALENVVLALRVRGLDAGSATCQAAAILVGLGLGERIRQRVSRLSAGEAQRVALGAALAGARGLLLVDEPTSRLDRPGAVLVARTLTAAAAAGQTVICATHDEELIRGADARVTLATLNAGPLVAAPPAATTTSMRPLP
jgi:ABC-type lipoprotein export system ATPase subunit